MRFGSRGPSEEVRTFPARWPRIRHRSALPEKAWENAIQGLGKKLNTHIVAYCDQTQSPHFPQQKLFILSSSLYFNK